MKRWMAALLTALWLLLGTGMGEAPPAMDAPEDAPLLRTARIRAAGDIMVHTTQLRLAQRGDTYDFTPQFELAAGALSNADYTIATLETTVGKVGRENYSGIQRFNSPDTLLDAIRNAGIDFLNLATEHILDRGMDGLVETVRQADAHGLEHGGANRASQEKNTPHIVTVNGIKIALLCYTQGTGGMERAFPDAVRYGVSYLTTENVEADMERARDAGAEVVIVVVHWGEEYKDEPGADVVELAKKLVAAGADVVLGSHAHRIQTVRFVTAEAADGTTRTGLVAYCLGSFLNNLSVQSTDIGIILDFTLRETQDGGFEVVNVGAVPIYVWRQEDDRILKAVPSLKYNEHGPEGMDSTRAARMRSTLKKVRSVMGKNIEILAE